MTLSTEMQINQNTLTKPIYDFGDELDQVRFKILLFCSMCRLVNQHFS